MAQTSRNRTHKNRQESMVIRYLVLGAWALVCLAPIIWFASIAFRPRTEIIGTHPIYWPTLTLDAWYQMINDWPIAHYLRNSLVSVTGSVIIEIGRAHV